MRRVLRSLAIAAIFVTTAALADPPGRVGRLSLVEGDVTFHDTAARESAPATLNWPVSTGAAISTAPGARAEVRIGSTAIRLDGATALEFVRVDDQAIRLRLEYGAVAIRVRSREVADELVLETRDARVSLSDAGRYRFEAGRAPDTTAVTVFQGGAHVDADGIAVAVRPGRRAEVGRAGAARVVEAFADDFDDWTFARDRHDDAARNAPRYVSPETTGYESLDEHGDWRTTAEYGPVWYPRAVPAGWAPYRAGRWAWIEPWGWTWIDEAPWGFAPFHYGRWALVGGVWGWVPGAIVARPVYAPALVGWIGRPGWSVSVTIGAVPSVGWFPLAPREVFVPAYRCSTAYVRNVNVTHVTNVVNVVNVQPRYAHRHVERAVTVVPAAAVSRGQPVGRAAMRVRHADLVAEAGGTNTPPPAARPPRHFGEARRGDGAKWTRRDDEGRRTARDDEGRRAPRDDDGRRTAHDDDGRRTPRDDIGRWGRRVDAPAPQQQDDRRAGQRGGERAAPPATTATPPANGEPRPPTPQPAPAAGAPSSPATVERRRDDDVRAMRERGQFEADRRPERRVERDAPSTVPSPRAVAPGPSVAPAPPVAPAPSVAPAPPVAGERPREEATRMQRERAASTPPQIATPAPPVAIERERRRDDGDRRPDRRFERERIAPPPAPAAPSAPVVAAPVQPRPAAPPQPREMPAQRHEPRFAPPSVPMQAPSAVMRPPAPAQPPAPQVRAPQPPQPATAPQPQPRGDGNRGHPREARPGERRG